jgi:hypothetical protein
LSLTLLHFARPLVALALLLSAGPVHADKLDDRWTGSFTAASAAEHLPPDGGGVIVVPAGEDAEAPAAALSDALGTAGHPALRPPSEVTHFDASDDELARAALAWARASSPKLAAPVRVAIVRCPPPSALHGPVAVVTIRDQRGAVVTSLFAERGHPPPAPPSPPHQPDGDDESQPDDVPSKRPPAAAPDHSPAFAEYLRRTLEVHNPRSRYIGLLDIHYRDYPEELTGTGLYHALGRDDLRARFVKRRALKAVLGTLGALVLVTGIGFSIDAGVNPHHYGFNCGGRDAAGNCLRYTLDDYQGYYDAAAVVGMVGGVATVLAAAIYDQHPVDCEGFFQVLRERDRILRRHYGLPIEDVTSRRRETPLRIALAPSVGIHGGGLSLALELP